MRRHTNLPAVAIVLMSASLLFGCIPRNRERAIQDAIAQVEETMRVAVPDLEHPEPYKYEDSGSCELVPGFYSSRETLRYQAKVILPPGDDGLARQAKAIQYWTDKGATVRELRHRPGPPNEVDYGGGSITALALPLRGSMDIDGPTELWVAATTPCISKID